ncbi:MAG: hypothetical protein KAT90_15395 [Gammaproteobacteria bacterium]|nr:hypothetical protein [Gammaproteobacteria bacterium]
MAWLNAIPKDSKESRLKQIDAIAEAEDAQPEYQLPEIGDAMYLVNALAEIGQGKTSGDMLIPIDWLDLKAWADMTGAAMSAGEFEAIRGLSSDYVSQFYRSRDADCPMPNIEIMKDQEAVEKKIRGIFSVLRG